MRVNIFFLISFLFCGNIKSQTYYFDCVTNQNELAFNSVYDSISQLEELKFILKSQIEQKSKVNL